MSLNVGVYMILNVGIYMISNVAVIVLASVAVVMLRMSQETTNASSNIFTCRFLTDKIEILNFSDVLFFPDIIIFSNFRISSVAPKFHMSRFSQMTWKIGISRISRFPRIS